MAKVQGGKFGHGFLSAGMGELSGPLINKVGSAPMRVSLAAIVGGTVSRLTGASSQMGLYRLHCRWRVEPWSGKFMDTFREECQREFRVVTPGRFMKKLCLRWTKMVRMSPGSGLIIDIGLI